jgi:hypothetical protein
MVSKSRLQLRIATGFNIFLIGPLIPAIFQRQSHEKVGEVRVEGDSLGPN